MMKRLLTILLTMLTGAACAQSPADRVWFDALGYLIATPAVPTFPTNSLAAYWGMRTNGVVTVFDEFDANNATATGSPVFGTAYGKRNDGVRLVAASSQYLTATNIIVVDVGDFSLSMWINMASLPTGLRGLVASTAQLGAVDRWGFYQGSNLPLRLVMDDGVNNTAVSPPISNANMTTGVWYHVAVTVDRNVAATFYLNGVNVGAYTNITSVSGAINPTIATRIGTFPDGSYVPASFFNGNIDEVAVHLRALTSNEVYTIYSTPQYYP